MGRQIRVGAMGLGAVDPATQWAVADTCYGSCYPWAWTDRCHGSKAVNRGDKRTRRLRGRVLALRENPRRVRVRVLALLENPQRDRVLEPALRENPCQERVLDRWFEARDSSMDILVLVPWIKERGRGCPLMGHEPRTMDLYGTKFNK